jgi:hypothetical protein
MILVPVGGEDAFQFIPDGFQICKIRQNDVNGGKLRVAEHDSAIHNDGGSAGLVNIEIHADLAGSSQTHNFQKKLLNIIFS